MATDTTATDTTVTTDTTATTDTTMTADMTGTADTTAATPAKRGRNIIVPAILIAIGLIVLYVLFRTSS